MSKWLTQFLEELYLLIFGFCFIIQDNQTCELGVCKYECVVDADCDATEYCDSDHTCKVGCRDDSGCAGNHLIGYYRFLSKFCTKYV